MSTVVKIPTMEEFALATHRGGLTPSQQISSKFTAPVMVDVRELARRTPAHDFQFVYKGPCVDLNGRVKLGAR